MKGLVAVIVSVCALLVAALLALASPAAAHCVETPVGFADLSPGHFAAAGGHESAIAHSGGVVGPPCDGAESNPQAPDENPPPGVP
jgi:hypothetical protein